MKRNELSLHRKEQMAASLKKLMTRKNLGRITIQELADDCGINRYTFYYHFQDIYDLLSWTFRQDFEKLFADRSRCPTLEAWIQNLIRYLKENAAVCKSALSSMGGDSFRRICVEDISGMMHDRLRELCRGRAVPDDYLDFLAAFYLEAVSGIMIGWIQSDMESSEEQLTRYLLIALEGSLETSLDRYVRSSPHDGRNRLILFLPGQMASGSSVLPDGLWKNTKKALYTGNFPCVQRPFLAVAGSRT